MEGDDLCVFDMILALFRRSKLGILCHILCWMYLHFGSESWIKKDTRRGAKPMGLMRLCGMVVYNSACAYCIIYILLVIAFNCLAFLDIQDTSLPFMLEGRRAKPDAQGVTGRYR